MTAMLIKHIANVSWRSLAIKYFALFSAQYTKKMPRIAGRKHQIPRYEKIKVNQSRKARRVLSFQKWRWHVLIRLLKSISISPNY
jgi:hypothetical protein